MTTVWLVTLRTAKGSLSVSAVAESEAQARKWGEKWYRLKIGQNPRWNASAQIPYPYDDIEGVCVAYEQIRVGDFDRIQSYIELDWYEA